MGVFYDSIPPSLTPWITEQKMLLVGTAPLSGAGHINISPKGGSNYGVLSPTLFWYMDLTGSGIETHAHLHEPGNARICIMFMAFSGAPRIVRIWGTGRAIENGTTEFAAFVANHKVPVIPGSRSIITVDVHQCASSCGWSVPYYDFVGHRPVLDDFFAKKEQMFKDGDEKESMDRYWAWKSQLSIDGLPGMKRGVEFAKRNGVVPLKKMVGPYAPTAPRTVERLGLVHLLLAVLLGVVIGAAGVVSLVSPERVRMVQGKGLVFQI